MITKIAVVAVVCAGAWYYFVGGRTLDEKMVRAYYDQGAHAFYKRDAELLCKQISRDAVLEEETVMNGQTQRATLNYDQACEASKASMEMFQKVGDSMGGILTVEYEFHLDSVAIDAGRKSARVKGTSLLKMGETVMQFSSAYDHQLVRELGQIKMLRSSQRTVMRLGGGRAMSQSDFFGK